MRKSDLELKIANLEELVRILSARIRKNEDVMVENFDHLFKRVGDGCSAVNSGVERTVSLTDVVMEVLDTMKLDLCYVTPPKKHVMLVPNKKKVEEERDKLRAAINDALAHINTIIKPKSGESVVVPASLKVVLPILEKAVEDNHNA